MSHLHELIAARVAEWRDGGYPHVAYPAISEILEFQTDLDAGAPRFLRAPQLRALETYWYLRLVEGTPHVLELYQRLYPATTEFMEALGLGQPHLQRMALDDGVDALLERVKTDDELVRDYKLESVRETLTLDYASYILALAMGAGKTILIGAIIATEFAMAQEYPDADFVQNALVFAPGKTIIEALRELADIPWDRALPPRMYGAFAASVSLTFTRDGDPDIPVIRGSLYNIVVTNTEKIRIQKEAVTRGIVGSLFSVAKEDEAKREVANRRLQAIASLPHLGIFSDEAHHTYGQSLLGQWRRDPATGERTFRESGIKKVRRTVDYLAANTKLICVVNTTGTPYFQRQPLRDVVIWYGLSEGIRDNILKEVGDEIVSYDFDEADATSLVSDIVRTFFRDYGAVRLPNGAPAKLAIYFPQTGDLAELRPVVEATLAEAGYPATIVLRNTSESTQQEIDAFNRLNDPRSPHRVLLLVNKGTEGWNCPSLFASALVRKLRTSNNFVLQAATRCLRQVPGNNHPARIYLSEDNRRILDQQLRETYGETLTELQHSPRERRSERLVLRKFPVPPLLVRRRIRVVEAVAAEPEELRLERPVATGAVVEKSSFTLASERNATHVLRAVGDRVTIELDDAIDARTLAIELSASYRQDTWTLLDEITRLYGAGEDVPRAHVPELQRQIESATRHYTVREEEVDVAVALIRMDPETGAPDARGWRPEAGADGQIIYTADITYFRDRERYLVRLGDIEPNANDLGFHYHPYNFDSSPEIDFFRGMLQRLNLLPEQVEDIYFTGALSDPRKTEFFVEYRDQQGRWRRYTPDFVVRTKDDRALIVEVKREHDRDHPVDGQNGVKAMQLRKWEELNPERLKYQIVFTDTDGVSRDDLTTAVRKLGVSASLDDAAARVGPPARDLAAFCEKYRVAELALFGSAADGSASADSDIDVLVTFAADARVTLMKEERMQRDLAKLFGRRVDIVNRASLEADENPVLRERVLREARRIYPEAERT